MTKFLIYLIESSIILTLIYLGYVVLFRKETYFNFIRIYLVLSIILALIIPLIHLNLELNRNKKLEKQVEQIQSFKSFYEKLVYWTDVEFVYNQSEEKLPSHSKYGPDKKASAQIQIKNKLSTSQKVFLWIYLSGLTFFLIRFIYLLFWLNNYSRKNNSEKIDGYKLIYLHNEVPSFSFFNRVYINKEALTADEFKKVFAHEITHVKQKHSLDLLLVHIMTIFQWFNPLVWRLHKSMKIVHEYIADRKVVEQGHELFDYQSLLLSQLVSIRSVELVNNFNLLSIKKRIAMMNKLKSGMVAKLKALLVLPIIVAVFFIFSDMTVTTQHDTKNTSRPSMVKYLESMNITRPIVHYYQEVNMADINFQVIYDGKQLTLNNEKCTLDNFSDLLKQKIASMEEKPKYFQVSLDFDVKVKMKHISVIFKGLRENNVLKTSYLVTPASEEYDENKNYAHLQKLPPIDAKEIEKDEITKKGIGILEFDDKIPVEQMMSDLENILNSEKEYILEYTYYDNTSYETYMKYNNSVRVVYIEVRNKYALKKYKKPFAELDDKTKKEVQFKYPIRLVIKSPEIDH